MLVGWLVGVMLYVSNSFAFLLEASFTTVLLEFTHLDLQNSSRLKMPEQTNGARLVTGGWGGFHTLTGGRENARRVWT